MAKLSLDLKIESIEVVANVKVGDDIAQMEIIKIQYDDIKDFLFGLSLEPKQKQSFQERMQEYIKQRGQ